MKILHVTPTHFSPNSVVGGGERYIDNVSSAIERASPSITNDILSFGEHPLSIARSSQSTLYIRKGVPEDISSFSGPALDKMLAEYNIVHVHQCLTTFGLFVAARARTVGARTIGTDHGGGEFHNLELFPSIASVFDVFHAQSNFAALAFRGFKVPVHVIFGPVDESAIPLSEKPRDSSHFVAIGRILPHKGYENAIRALPQNTKLTIVGRAYDLEYFDWLSKLAQNTNGSQVAFKTDIDDKEMYDLVSRAGLLLHCGVHTDYRNHFHAKPELLSFTPLEAMCSGTPAIVSRAAALPELAKLPGCQSYDTSERLRELIRRHLCGDLFATTPTEIREKAVLHYGLGQFGPPYLKICREILAA